MNNLIDTRRLLSNSTQQALWENVQGYVNQEQHYANRVEIVRQRTGLQEIYRMDLGQNPDGCSSEVSKYLEDLITSPNRQRYLSEYPEVDSPELRKKIATIHSIRPEWIVLSAGLEQMIDMIAASLIDSRDRFLITDPGFYVFDEYSRRAGGIPILLHLDETDHFRWTEIVHEQYCRIFQTLRPKLVWIANPNNPTGTAISLEDIELLISIARDNLAFIVIDEAFGEYSDLNGAVHSASSLLGNYDNLIVLRSFSKAYGLPGIRLGYAMTANEHVRTALKVHRTNYPITKLSFDIAMKALDHFNYLDFVREKLNSKRLEFKKMLQNTFHVNIYHSDSAIGLLRCSPFSAKDLIIRLENDGILVAPVYGDSIIAKTCVRFTLGNDQANTALARVLQGFSAN